MSVSEYYICHYTLKLIYEIVYMKTDVERIIVFNHFYRLKHDLKRSYIYSNNRNSETETEKCLDVDRLWLSKIHPAYAMLFVLASEPLTYSAYKERVAFFMDITQEEAERIISPFLDRNEPFYSKYGGVVSQFPRNVLIDAGKAINSPVEYTLEEFRFDMIDFQQERFFHSPMTVVFMPNNSCTTNCIYCYADKDTKVRPMSFLQVKAIVKACHELRMKEFILTGGDVFVYKYWKELLACMRNYDMNIGLLSTKTPLLEEEVKLLSDYQPRMQFSLDSVTPSVLKSMVGMNSDYIPKVKKTFEHFDKYGLDFKVATVVTRLNASVSNLSELYHFLMQFSKMVHWEIRIALKSLYSKWNYEELKVTKENVRDIDDWVQQIKKEAKFKISWEPVETKHFFEATKGSRSFAGARCSANYSNIMILPDGKATICEQLYWNPRYLIGDLTKQSIPEVWNSPQALKLAFPEKSDFRDVSPCKKCQLFEDCYAFPNRCIVDVLKGYGEENADFPDPRCCKAPDFITELRY